MNIDSFLCKKSFNNIFECIEFLYYCGYTLSDCFVISSNILNTKIICEEGLDIKENMVLNIINESIVSYDSDSIIVSKNGKRLVSYFKNGVDMFVYWENFVPYLIDNKQFNFSSISRNNIEVLYICDVVNKCLELSKIWDKCIII